MKRALVGCAEQYDFRELTSLQCSRGQIMPSAVAGRDGHSIQSWWNPDNLLQSSPHSTISHKSNSISRCSHPLSPQHQDVHTIHSRWKPENLLQNRPRSTSTQKSSIGDAHASAILHGPKSPSQSHRQSNVIARAQDSNQARRTRKGSVALKDKAYGRRDSVALKDDAYIRSTMNVPTQKDYPSIKALIFKSPSEAISTHVRDGIFAKKFKLSKSGVFQCIISCHSLGIEAEGEGTRKVFRSDSSEFVR